MRSSRILALPGDQKILILAVLICAVMGVLYPRFLGFENIISILVKISIEGVIFIGMTYLIILGEIDLSVGSVMALCSAMSIIGQEHGRAGRSRRGRWPPAWPLGARQWVAGREDCASPRSP